MSRRHRHIPCIKIVSMLLLLSSNLLIASTLRIVSWNVESGDADPRTLDDFIAQLEGIDIWGLSEVQNDEWAGLFEAAAEVGEGADFIQVLGTTGGADRLLIIYNTNRLEIVESYELDHINIGGRVRAPLVASFIDTENNFQFLFVVNHLYRSNEERRHEQARLLNEWAANQTLPIIAVGDYNFDWAVTGGENDHDQGYDFLTEDGVFDWVQPELLVKTQCFPRYNSVLDFVFLGNVSTDWLATSEILETSSEYCPDTSERSDHRPVYASIEISTPVQQSNLKQILLERISSLEQELAVLKDLVQQMD